MKVHSPLPSEVAPKISVVITAYNRREFVKDALKSVLNQKLDRQDYEVILVKNFADESIDNFANSNGVKLVFSDETNLGRMCLRGLNNSSGEIVSLLDDDDVFHPYKLSIVLEAMSDQAVCFMHNRSTAFSTTIHVTDSNYAVRERQRKLRLGEIRTLALLCAVKEGGTSNSSSVTFRKGIIDGYEKVLEETAWGPAFTLSLSFPYSVIGMRGG